MSASKTATAPKAARAFRLSEETIENLAALAREWGIPQAAVVEVLVREAVVEGRSLRALPASEGPALHEVRCENCGRIFEAERSSRRTCSDRCRKALSRREETG